MTKAATKILIKGALLTIPPSLVMGANVWHEYVPEAIPAGSKV